MSSERFEDVKVAAATAQKTDRTAGEKVARVDLVTYMGLPREKLREHLVKCRIDEMKTFCRNSGLKVPAPTATILNYRDMGLIRATGPSLAPLLDQLECTDPMRSDFRSRSKSLKVH